MLFMMDYLEGITIDFYGAFATGVVCQQRMLTFLETWFRPFLGGDDFDMILLL